MSGNLKTFRSFAKYFCISILVAALFALLVAAILVSCGKLRGQRRSGGIYVLPSIGEQEGTSPADGISPAPLGDIDVERVASSIFHNVRYRFTDFRPEQNGLVWQPEVDISVVLEILDVGDRVKELSIDTFKVNGVDLPATVDHHRKGFSIEYSGYLCQKTGWYHVELTLHDDKDHRFVKTWSFEFDNDPPHYQGISPVYELGPDGHLHHTGYRVDLDSAVKPRIAPLLTRPELWRFKTKGDGFNHRVARVRMHERFGNMIEVFPVGEGWKRKKGDVDLVLPELPGWRFKKGNKRMSLTDDDCLDHVPPDPEDPPPAEVEIMNWYDEEGEIPVPPEEDCCEVDMRWMVEYNSVMCCAPKMEIHFGICRECTHYVVFTEGCYRRSRPCSIQEFDYLGAPADDRPIVPCSYDPLWGSLPGGVAITKVFHFNPWTGDPMTAAEYTVQVGQFTYSDERGHYWQPCASWSMNVEGDLENPEMLVLEVIPGDQMAAEVQANLNCERYHPNENNGNFDELLELWESGCGPVLKIRVRDKCFGFHGEETDPDPDGDHQPLITHCYDMPKKVFDDYFDTVHWWMVDLQPNAAYVCDNTGEYPTCQDSSGPKQDYTFYYLLPQNMDEQCRLVNGEWICDGDIVYGIVVQDWSTWWLVCHNWIRPTIVLDDDAPDWPNGIIVLESFGDVLRNPTVSGAIETYGPNRANDGPAPFDIAKVEFCQLPTAVEILLEMDKWSTIEDSLGQGVGNAYEESDLPNYDDENKEATGWRQYITMGNPPVFFRQGSWSRAELEPHYYNDSSDQSDGVDDIRRVTGLTSADDDPEEMAFTVAWDGRQWEFEVGPENGPAEGEPPMYPPGRYVLKIRVTEPFVAEKELGTVHLVWGGLSTDSFGGHAPSERIKTWLCNKDIQSIHYSSEELFAYYTTLTFREYGSVLHYDGHGTGWGTKDYGEPIPKDLVFINACESDNKFGQFNTNSFIGWVGDVDSWVADIWAYEFYDAFLNSSGAPLNIADAYDEACDRSDKHYTYIVRRWRYSYDDFYPFLRTNDFTVTIEDFEKTTK